VADAHERLVSAMGAERAAAAGLLAMGSAACALLLSGEEEAAVEAGMREHGRAFRRIREERVPARSVLDLQNFYYNVSSSWLHAPAARARMLLGWLPGSLWPAGQPATGLGLTMPPSACMQVWKLRATPRSRAW
jgi:hypothetical protein